MPGDTRNHPPESLLAAARAGDRDARGRLLRAHHDDLVRFCGRYLPDVHSAEDAAQDSEAILVAEAGWPSGPLRPWLLRVARNRCLDLLRRRSDGREGAGSFLGWSMHASPITGPSTALIRAENHEALARHVAALRPDHAEALMLRYFEGLSRAEIGEVLGLGSVGAKSRLYEARKELRERMSRGSSR